MHAEFEQLGLAGKVGLWFRELGRMVAWLGLADIEKARRFCDVLLVARGSGDPVAVFQYKALGDANHHVAALVLRLDSLDVDTFCAELGLDPSEVRGDGIAPDAPSEVAWAPVPKDRRKRYWPTGVAVVPERHWSG